MSGATRTPTMTNDKYLRVAAVRMMPATGDSKANVQRATQLVRSAVRDYGSPRRPRPHGSGRARKGRARIRVICTPPRKEGIGDNHADSIQRPRRRSSDGHSRASQCNSIASSYSKKAPSKVANQIRAKMYDKPYNEQRRALSSNLQPTLQPGVAVKST